jgi:riboflavin kinase/FMN adenylyltransferase
MEVFSNLHGVRKDSESVLTVGTFDGVHRGHQFIIEKLRERASALGLRTTLVTFEPHPQLVLKSIDKPNLKILTTAEEKLELLLRLKVDRVVVIEFTKEFARTSSLDFVRTILFETIGFREILIGYDHAFGKDREGDIATLRKMAPEVGFQVDELPAFIVEDTAISSTNIRNLLRSGRPKSAAHFLGRNYTLTATVVRGEGRGKTLQFPTANLRPVSTEKVVPGDGVYAVFISLGNDRHKGMMNIGMRPTFDSLQHTLEVHIFDFDSEIYDQRVTVEFVDKIRSERRFASAGDLVKQLELDKMNSLKTLEN